jgi:hypothetical protein
MIVENSWNLTRVPKSPCKKGRNVNAITEINRIDFGVDNNKFLTYGIGNNVYITLNIDLDKFR